ncbi:MAG: MIP/aquaporin family protein [Candidatus Brocadia sp.]
MCNYFLCNFVSVRGRFRIVVVLLMAVFIYVIEWSMPGLFIHSIQAQTSTTDKKPMSVAGKSTEEGKTLLGVQSTAQNESEMGHVPLPIIDWNDQLKLFELSSTTQQQPEKTQTSSAWLLITTIIVVGVIFYLWRVNIVSNAVKYGSEFVGTFALIFIGAGSVCADYYLVKSGSQGFGLLGIAVAFGLVVVAIAYSFGYISGAHINPAVTVSMVVLNRMDAKTGFLYIVSQLGGAIFGGYLLKMLFPAAMAVNLGTCALGSGVTILQAIIMEAVITFFLVFVVYATVIDKRATPALAGLAIGLVVLFGVMVGGAISGGSMNPARVFGPALASGHFDNHYVWWVGPIAGGVLAGLVYENFFAEKAKNKQQLIDSAKNDIRISF